MRRERRRFAGERLRGPRLLARHVALRNRALLDGPQRFATHALEREKKPLLGRRNHDVGLATVVHDGDEIWRGREVVVPQAMMGHLEVPHALARTCVETKQRLAEQVRALALAAIPVVTWRADREIHETARAVHGERRPDVRVPHVRPRTVLPRVVAQLARLRNSLEAPYALAGAHVEGLDVPRGIAAVHEPIADAVAEDDQVPPHDWGRRVGVVLATHGAREVRGEIDLAAVAERRDGLAGGRVQRDQAPSRIDEDATLASVGPRGHAPVHEARAVARLAVRLPHLRVVGPVFHAGLRIERDDAIVRRGEEQRVMNGQRCGLEKPWTRRLLSLTRSDVLLACLPGERGLEPADVLAIDVGQRRVLEATGIVAVSGPVH